MTTRDAKATAGGGVDVNEDVPFAGLTYKIIACAIEVHKTLGPGYQEVFYQRALRKELDAAGLDATREVDINVVYKGIDLGPKRIDFVVEQCLVEIKAKRNLEDVDKIQTLSYLKASGYSVALLLNFGAPTLQIKRFANTRAKK